MTHTPNRDRAGWAEAAILKFVDETGVEGDREAVADLGHFCDRHQLDFLPLVERGIGHWHIEQREPDDIGALPDVTIAIDGEVQP